MEKGGRGIPDRPVNRGSCSCSGGGAAGALACSDCWIHAFLLPSWNSLSCSELEYPLRSWFTFLLSIPSAIFKQLLYAEPALEARSCPSVPSGWEEPVL